jgi:hypothetical protein
MKGSFSINVGFQITERLKLHLFEHTTEDIVECNIILFEHRHETLLYHVEDHD